MPCKTNVRHDKILADYVFPVWGVGKGRARAHTQTHTEKPVHSRQLTGLPMNCVSISQQYLMVICLRFVASFRPNQYATGAYFNKR